MQPYKTISNDEYRAMDGWSSTQIKQVVQHSIERALIPLKDSEALQFGRAFHTYMEDPSQFLTEYAVFDDEQLIADILAKRPDISSPTMTKDYKTAKSQFDADNADKTIIGLQDFRTLERMRVETMKNPMVENLMQSHVNEPILEGSFFSTIDVPADFTGDHDDLSVLCKARPDFLAETKDEIPYTTWSTGNHAETRHLKASVQTFFGSATTCRPCSTRWLWASTLSTSTLSRSRRKSRSTWACTTCRPRRFRAPTMRCTTH